MQISRSELLSEPLRRGLFASAVSLSMEDSVTALWRIKIRQDNRRCTGGWIWPAAPALCLALDSLGIDWNGKKVIELGSGTGYVGIYLAMKGASVTLTDQPAALSILKQNMFLNLSDNPDLDTQVTAFEWGADLPESLKDKSFDYVVASDVLYMLSDVRELLLRSISDLCTEQTQVFICHQRRIPEEEVVFFSRLAAHRLKSELILDSTPLFPQCKCPLELPDSERYGFLPPTHPIMAEARDHSAPITKTPDEYSRRNADGTVLNECKCVKCTDEAVAIVKATPVLGAIRTAWAELGIQMLGPVFVNKITKIPKTDEAS